MHAILKDNLTQINAICAKHNVKTLFAFGSICKHDFSQSSDIDLLVSFHQMDFGDYADNYFSIADEFESLFNRPEDLITEKSLSNPYFIASINESKKFLYGQ